MSAVWLALVTHTRAEPTSEERPPAVCPFDHFVTGLKCTGRFCDNIELRCEKIDGLTWGKSIGYMPAAHSLEVYVPFSGDLPGYTFGGTPAARAMVGLSCRRRFCDYLDPLTVSVDGATLGTESDLTSLVSEENDKALSVPAGNWIVNGVWCDGFWCDNVAFIVGTYTRLPR